MRDEQIVEVMRRANPIAGKTDLRHAYGEDWDDALAVLIARHESPTTLVSPAIGVRTGRGWLIAAAAAALVVTMIGGAAFLTGRTTTAPVQGEPATSTEDTTPVEETTTVPDAETTAPPQTTAAFDDLTTVVRFIELGWGGDPDGAMALVDLDPDLLGITTNSLPFRSTILALTESPTEAEDGEEPAVEEDPWAPLDPVPGDVAATMLESVLEAATALETSVTEIDCIHESSFEDLAAVGPTFVACTARVESRLTAVLPGIPPPSSEGEEPDLPDQFRWFAFVADSAKVTGVVALPSWTGAVDAPDELTPYAERFGSAELADACLTTLESVSTCVDFWLGIAEDYQRIRDVVYEPFEVTHGSLRFVFSEFFWAEYDERSSVTIHEDGELVGAGSMYDLYGVGTAASEHYIFWDPTGARDVTLRLPGRTIVLPGSVLDTAMAALFSG